MNTTLTIIDSVKNFLIFLRKIYVNFVRFYAILKAKIQIFFYQFSLRFLASVVLSSDMELKTFVIRVCL